MSHPALLFFLAPVPAEYLIGYLELTGNFPALLGGLAFFAPLYGGAALTIREVTRRTGRGWPTIILLSFAFGVFQAGLVDHSLFNPAYQDIEWWEESLKPTYIPPWASVQFALKLIMGCDLEHRAPMQCETFFPPRRPLVRPTRLSVTIFCLPCRPHSLGTIDEEDFLPSAAQFIGSAVVVLAFIGAAFLVKKRPGPTSDKPVPNPWVIGTLTLGLLSLVTLIEVVLAILGNKEGGFEAGWVGTSINAAVMIVLAILVWRWTQRREWSALHILALTGGALLTRAWIAFLVEPIGEVALPAKLIHNAVFALGIMGLLYAAARKARKTITRT